MQRLLRPPAVFPGLSARVSAYVWAGLLVLVAFATRLSLQREFGGGQSFSLFYSAVIIASYALGRGPAAFTVIASALLGFFCFLEPQFAWKASLLGLTTVGFFLLNCAAIVIAISGLVRALERLSVEQGRVQAVANSHADLFRELNERISHHLRLVAGVLMLQAKGEPEPDVLRGLKTASERSVTLARVQREIAGGGERPVDFDAFARALVRSVCLSQGHPVEQVTIEGAEVWLPPDEATSLAVALVECVSALLAPRDPGVLRVQILPGASETRIAIAKLDSATGAQLATLSGGYLLRAMVEQLGAGISLRADGEGSALELAVPHLGGQFLLPAAPAVGTLH